MLARSSLERTDTPNDELAVATGEVVEIPYRVDRRGDRADVPVTVELGTTPGLAAESGVRRRYPSVGNGRVGSFWIKANDAGNHQAEVSIRRQYNEPRASVSVLVGNPGRTVDAAAAAILGGLVAVTALAIGAARRRRSKRDAAGP